MIRRILPMFPLELVVFPSEKIALHIFEKRYQQLIADCHNEAINFGIPTYINNTIEYGTEVRLIDIVKKYPSGACDIICEGLQTFKISRFYNTLHDKLYAGGDVIFLKNEDCNIDVGKSVFLELLKQFYSMLDIDTPIIQDEFTNSYTLSHKIGLTFKQEHELLKITSEAERYAYIIKHLKTTLPVLKAINRTKETIKLNGHFKNFDPLEFKDYT
ncbi:LON peptidase substrate-binding domain-containing protein [Dokdonia sp. Hel_I_53]|uniref:LON peptidase substrate-binding domain-containing protein n=1 Tax=Dokdonia sp. Hel_I_53 TaxID=1566287 RepID=UPI00119A0D75|nr:LON peptidase substrate-binding domain-containing protein [Dokdonia sp. Hel_I_53]TVZ51760.1 hypothetical protein OD90_0912 [Dokdonia sp. Hel_I_53]